MKKMKKTFALLFGVSLLLFSCLIPEKFTCAIYVDKDGGYSVSFKGTVLFYAALQEIAAQGSVSSGTDRQIKAWFDASIGQDPRIKKYEYRNSGRAYVEYYQQVTDGSSLDLSKEFGLPLHISVSPDMITIIEEAVEGETASMLTEFVKLGFQLDGVIEITSELPVLDSGRQKVGSKYILFGPQVIRQVLKVFPSMDVIIKIGMNPSRSAGSRANGSAGSDRSNGSTDIGAAIRSFLNKGAGSSSGKADSRADSKSGGMDIGAAIRSFLNKGAGSSSGKADSRADSKSGGMDIGAAIRAFLAGGSKAGSKSAESTNPAEEDWQEQPPAEPPAAAQTMGEQNTFSPTHTIVTNDGTNLRLRSRPSTNSVVIMSLDYGSTVQVLRLGDSFIDDDGNGGNWVYISTPKGVKGWCFGGYLKPLR